MPNIILRWLAPFDHGQGRRRRVTSNRVSSWVWHALNLHAKGILCDAEHVRVYAGAPELWRSQSAARQFRRL